MKKGCFSLVVSWPKKDSPYILKCPLLKGPLARQKWFAHVQREKIFLGKYAPKRSGVILPKIMDYSEYAQIQTKISGVPLTEDVYQSLPRTDRLKIAKQLASFFLKLHQKTKMQANIKRKNISVRSCQHFFDQDEKTLCLKCQTALKRYCPKTSLCICITDLKAEHILFNQKTKRVGLVDFGAAQVAFPEDEFKLLNPIRSHMSLDMLKQIILTYNKQGGCEAIPVEFIKYNLILGAMKEIYETYKGRVISDQEKKRVKKILFDFVAKVEKGFSPL